MNQTRRAPVAAIQPLAPGAVVALVSDHSRRLTVAAVAENAQGAFGGSAPPWAGGITGQWLICFETAAPGQIAVHILPRVAVCGAPSTPSRMR